MDIISSEINFYLPGYDVKSSVFSQFIRDNSAYIEMEEREFSDSHIQDKRCVIQSPRLGNISFNNAEFVDFVIEFTRKIKGYVYLGNCQMILISIDRERNPDYDLAKVYDLDEIINTPESKFSLDSFLHRTFNILRENNNESNSFIRILNRKSGRCDVLNKISNLYKEAITVRYYADKYEIVINNII